MSCAIHMLLALVLIAKVRSEIQSQSSPLIAFEQLSMYSVHACIQKPFIKQ